MSWRAAMLGSLVAALEQPAWWVLALASFLVRGGLAVFVLPVVILPTPAGLVNAFGAEITGLAFGSPSGSFISAIIVAIVAVTTWLLAAGLLAAWTDVALVAAAAQRLGRPASGSSGLAWRALGVRLASYLPLAIALTWGVARIVDAVWGEYLHPGDLATPLVLRIALRIPDVIAVTGLAWLAGEAAGGLAVRHLVVGGRSAAVALARGWLDLLARPSAVATLAVTTIAWLVVALPLARSAGDAWDRLRGLLAAGGPDPGTLVLALTLFAAIWLAGIAAVGVVAAWRSAAWTMEVARRLPLVGPSERVFAPPAAAGREVGSAALSPIAARHGGGGEAV
jgi:hypothetical protein